MIADGKLSGDLGPEYRPRGGLVLIFYLFLCCLYGASRSSLSRLGILYVYSAPRVDGYSQWSSGSEEDFLEEIILVTDLPLT